MHSICVKIYMYMWDLKYDTNELTYETETDSQRWKANMVTKGEKVQRGDKLGVQDQNIKYNSIKLICDCWMFTLCLNVC